MDVNIHLAVGTELNAEIRILLRATYNRKITSAKPISYKMSKTSPFLQ